MIFQWNGGGTNNVSVSGLPPPPVTAEVPAPPSDHQSSRHPQPQVHQHPLGQQQMVSLPAKLPPYAGAPAVGGSNVLIKRCDVLCHSSQSSGGSELFTPVVSCEVTPVIILGRGSERFDDDDQNDLRNLGVRMHYQWSRGPARAVCFFHLQSVAITQCAVTLRCFCSYECFRRGQVQLRRFYLSEGKIPVPSQSDAFSYGVPVTPPDTKRIDENRQVDLQHFELLRSAGLVCPRSKELWTSVGYCRDYTPTPSDVGHQMRLDVCVEPIYHHKQSHHQIVGGSGPSYHPRTQSSVDSEEADWWGTVFSKREWEPDTYRTFTTACVVPMAPLIERRHMLPVGMAMNSNGKHRILPQRVVQPGTPLAEALGIGMMLMNILKSAKKLKEPDPLQVQQLQKQITSVRAKRIALLTEHTFTNWGTQLSPQPHIGNDSTNAVDAHILRPLNVMPPLGAPNDNTSSDSFSVMTWNVLADIYATPEAYPYSDSYVLSWNFRRDRILAEILAYSPDIICLQEIQGDHFEDFFAPALLRRGYEGLYKQKTTKLFRGGGKHKGGKYVCDGCATFFRVPKFQLLDHFGIEFARVVPPTHSKDKRLNKDNVALVLCLEMTSTKQNKKNILVIANTHILANPEAPDVKIWQANTLTSVLTEYMEKTQTYNKGPNMGGCMPGLVVCGDFNSTPDSAVYELVTAGRCSARHPELANSEACAWLQNISLGHGLALTSSYSVAASSRYEASRLGGQQPLGCAKLEPEFTNYTHEYVGCLDYIFFDQKIIRVQATLDLVTEIQLLKESHLLQLSDWALPSPQRPSDHLPLVTRFEWIRI